MMSKITKTFLLSTLCVCSLFVNGQNYYQNTHDSQLNDTCLTPFIRVENRYSYTTRFDSIIIENLIASDTTMYDNHGNPIIKKNSEGALIEYEYTYDDEGNVQRIKEYQSGELCLVHKYEYDGTSLIKKVYNSNGETLSMTTYKEDEAVEESNNGWNMLYSYRNGLLISKITSKQSQSSSLYIEQSCVYNSHGCLQEEVVSGNGITETTYYDNYTYDSYCPNRWLSRTVKKEGPKINNRYYVEQILLDSATYAKQQRMAEIQMLNDYLDSLRAVNQSALDERLFNISKDYVELSQTIIPKAQISIHDDRSIDTLKGLFVQQIQMSVNQANEYVDLCYSRREQSEKMTEYASQKEEQLRTQASKMVVVPEVSIPYEKNFFMEANTQESLAALVLQEEEKINQEYALQMQHLEEYAKDEDQRILNDFIASNGNTIQRANLAKDVQLQQVIMKYENYEHITSIYSYIIENNKRLNKAFQTSFSRKKDFCVGMVKGIQENN